MLRIDLRGRKKPSQSINPAHQHNEVEDAQDSEDEVEDAQGPEGEVQVEELTPCPKRTRPKRATSKKSQEVLNDGISELTSSQDPDWAMDIWSENNENNDVDVEHEGDGSQRMDIDLDSDAPETSKSGKAKKAKPQRTTKTGDEKGKEKQDDIRSAVMAGRQKKPSAVGCYKNFPMTV
jgi:hypothetical protein